MMLKFLSPKSASPRTAVAYIAGEANPRKVHRDEITLLDGSPEDFVRVAEGLTFSQTYRSFVASWAIGDAPTADQLRQFIDSFKALSFGGLDECRFAYCMYLHSSGGKVDVHALVASVDLRSGKHFNVAPPNSILTFDSLQTWMNARFGWADPKDPRLARLTRRRYGKYGPLDGGPPAPGTRASVTNTINAALTVLVTKGVVTDRQGVLEALRNAGEDVVAVGKHHLSIVRAEFERPIHLRGVIFGSDFTPALLQSLAPLPRRARTAADHEAEKNPEQEAVAKRLFDAAVERRTSENQGRYNMAPQQRRKRKRSSEFDSVSVPMLDDIALPPGRPPAREPSDADPGQLGNRCSADDFGTSVSTWAALLQGVQVARVSGEQRPAATRDAPLTGIETLKQVQTARLFQARLARVRAQVQDSLRQRNAVDRATRARSALDRLLNTNVYNSSGGKPQL